MIQPFKYDLGLFTSNFDPLTIGQLDIIYKSASECKDLYIVLNYSDDDLVDYRKRYQWIYNLSSHFDNITIVPLKLDSNFKDNFEENIKFNIAHIDGINKNLDVIYVDGLNCLNDNLNDNLTDAVNFLDDVEVKIINHVEPPAYEVHKNPFKYWDFIPNIVKEYYVKKVLIIGNESTGKSTLVQTLANLYNTNCVLEYSRDVCSRCGGEDFMLTEDFEEVLYQHKLNIKNGAKESNKLLFIDTDSFMTYYYRKHTGLLESDENESILDNEDNIRLISGDYDLVLFMESDVPYVQDDLRILDRNENGLRESCSEIIKEIYKKNGINFKVISGSYSERLEKVQSLINDEFGL
ncbi:MAG: AAA family ATPase [Methanobacteriaceae archaeon]|nr:AAA family ATPase [Methanobacteriaceae archaeon]